MFKKTRIENVIKYRDSKRRYFTMNERLLELYKLTDEAYETSKIVAFDAEPVTSLRDGGFISKFLNLIEELIELALDAEEENGKIREKNKELIKLHKKLNKTVSTLDIDKVSKEKLIDLIEKETSKAILKWGVN